MKKGRFCFLLFPLFFLFIIFDCTIPNDVAENGVWWETTDIKDLSSEHPPIMERHKWIYKDGFEVTKIKGWMVLDGFNPNGCEFQVYLERELYLSNLDCVEFIVSYNNKFGASAKVVLYNNGFLVWGPSIKNLRQNDRIYYFMELLPFENHVYVEIECERTGEIGEYTFTDSSPSHFITKEVGSAEIYTRSIINDFYTQATIDTDWMWDALTKQWYRPDETFRFLNLDASQPYVDATHYTTLADGRHRSILKVFRAPVHYYNSIQCRVQRDITDPWAQSKNVAVGIPIRIGTMHDNSGYFAEDQFVIQKVTGPGGYVAYPKIGEYIVPYTPGPYVVVSETLSEPYLTDTASFWAGTVEPHPYSSIQCRVQRNINDPWDTCKTLSFGQAIRVGTMYDGTGYFADNRYIIQLVTGPNGFMAHPQVGDYIMPLYTGTYTVTSTTTSNPILTNSSSFTVY